MLLFLWLSFYYYYLFSLIILLKERFFFILPIFLKSCIIQIKKLYWWTCTFLELQEEHVMHEWHSRKNGRYICWFCVEIHPFVCHAALWRRKCEKQKQKNPPRVGLGEWDVSGADPVGVLCSQRHLLHVLVQSLRWDPPRSLTYKSRQGKGTIL